MMITRASSVSAAFVLALVATSARSDVTRDGTIGPGASVQAPAVNGKFTIDQTLGMLRGQNLFHSFSKFDLAPDQAAIFTASAPIQNVISRVTGGRSTIQGIIDSRGIAGANFILMNPAGIAFGNGAELKVDGSFTATTADLLAFDENRWDPFLADVEKPVLSAGSLSRFGFLSEAIAPIEVLGGQISSAAGDMALVGGAIGIADGAKLLAPEHWISLVSAGGRGSIGAAQDATRTTFDTSGLYKRGDISISGQVSAHGLALESDHLTVSGGVGQGLRSLSGGIDIHSSGAVHLDRGRIRASSESARVAPITVQAESVALRNGSSIEVRWAPKDGEGIDAGTGRAIDLSVSDLTITGSSSIISRMKGEGTGRGGNVSIHARRSVSIDNGGEFTEIALHTENDTHAASLNIQAPVVDLGAEAEISVRSERQDGPAAGTGGEIEIRAGRLTLRDGAQIDVGAIHALNGASNAGGIRILQAKEVILAGTDPETGRASSIRSGENAADGRGGDIQIQAERLHIRDGAQISSASRAGGPAGNILLQVNELWGDRATISTSTPGGAGGNIRIGPGSSVVLHKSEISTAGGQSGGNIESDSEALVLSRSRISTTAQDGPGGDITLRSRTVVRDRETVIDASSGTGAPGDVLIGGQTLVRGQLMDLDAAFLAAEQLLRPQCAVRPPQDRASLVLAARPGVGSSSEGWLLALEESANGLPDVALPAAGERVEQAGTLASVVQPRASDLSAAAAAENPEGGADAQHAALRARQLRGAAQRQQAAGAYRQSLPNLLQALLAAEAAGDLEQIAAALGSLGNAYVALQRPQQAEEHLRRGLATAREAQADGTAALLLNNLGNFLALEGRLDEALASYQEAWALARTSGGAVHAAQALANGARAALRSGRTDQADRLLAQVQRELGALPASQESVFARIHAAQTERLRAEGASMDPARVLRAHAQLMAAVEQALAIGPGAERALSYALGHLGALYEGDGRHAEALQAAERALLAAQRANAPEAEYRWHALAGRNLWQLGRREDALAAYRRAVAMAESLRLESAPGAGPSELGLREGIAPVYLALVDLLLRKAGAAGADALGAQGLLRETRTTMEALKAAELREYFHDECAAELARSSNEVDRIEPDAAVVYPILLPERTQLLVSRGGMLRAYEVPVGAQAIAERVSALRSALEDPASQAYLEPAQQLYRWLIEPFAADLARAQVRTLVLVPYGALRTIPLAALHDGDGFLVQRFALAVTPGLSLTAPRSLPLAQLRLLAGGVSQSVQGFPELPHASAEVHAIGSMYRGEVLLDAEFTNARLREELEANPFSVLHIASHSSFSADAGQSYVLTHDGRISMQELSAWVDRTRFRDQPLELIVLSACETAAADPQTALGLAGIAVQSGARSALGSLWRIDDEAAKELIVEFYARLRQPGHSRAQALRQAQLALLQRPEFAHPNYWSAFLLIGSWL